MTLQERVALCFDQLEECRDRIDALVKKNEKLENRVLELEALLAQKEEKVDVSGDTEESESPDVSHETIISLSGSESGGAPRANQPILDMSFSSDDESDTSEVPEVKMPLKRSASMRLPTRMSSITKPPRPPATASTSAKVVGVPKKRKTSNS